MERYVASDKQQQEEQHQQQQDERKRFMVCAPTNKAISVLASRFERVNTGVDRPFVSMLVMGSMDKLLDGGEHSKTDPLRKYALFTWQKEMTSDCFQLQEAFQSAVLENSPDRSRVLQMGKFLRDRLITSLSHLPEWLTVMLDELVQHLQSFQQDAAAVSVSTIVKLTEGMANTIGGLDKVTVRGELLANVQIIFCTLCTAGSGNFYPITAIDDLIVDEAAAATEPELSMPFRMLPKRLLIVGDPKQLPSTVVSDHAKRLGLDVSLHERLMYKCKHNYIQLNCQYRMHPDIAAFSAKRFYGNNIQNGANVLARTFADGLAGPAYSFCQVHGQVELTKTNSLVNLQEAQVVVKLVQLLASQGCTNMQSLDRLRILTFYTGQVALIQRLLKEMSISISPPTTVDSAQGCESDIVIVSFVRGLDKAGFLTDDRRLNVALTRAKHQLICVGNVEAMVSLTNARTLRLLGQDAHKRNLVFRV
jgi:senataxin